MALLFDIGLGLLLLACATAAVTGRDSFAAIVFFIVYGLFIAVAWVRLEQVNVALAEAAIGAGLTGALLVGAWARLQRLREGDWAAGDEPRDEAGGPEDPYPGPLGRAAIALLSAGLSGVLVLVVLDLPAPAGGLADAVHAALPAVGVGNEVTAVLLAFRAYDTLLESIVVLTALVAVWAITAPASWGGRPGIAQHARPDGVLATFGRFLAPVGLVVAVYLVWVGSSAPGGAFQAGTVLAAVLLLAAMAGLAEPPPVFALPVRLALVVGPAVFLLIAVLGLAAGAFLALPEGWGKALIITIELFLTASIAATLALLVLGPPRREGAGEGGS